MEILKFNFKSAKSLYSKFGISTGVVNSGNLEILLEKNSIADELKIKITTKVPGYGDIWSAVLADFALKYSMGGCSLVINDSGATPAVVALRLRQLYELFAGNVKNLVNSNYIELNARERIAAISDIDSFQEWLGPELQITSPNLAGLDLPTSFDDGVVIGRAKLNEKDIYIAAQNFAFMGGAVGEVNGAKLTGLCLRALRDKPYAVILLLDSGGVRLQEANAGEIAISEIIAALMKLKLAKIPVLGVVAGKNGAFGGIGIVSAVLDNIILTENARTGVSGPEVIETVMGISEYDSSDRALVWRTCGGRHRAIIGDGKYSLKTIVAIKNLLSQLIDEYNPLSLAVLQEENQLLQKRLSLTQECTDGRDIWDKLGYNNTDNIPNLTDIDFLKILK